MDTHDSSIFSDPARKSSTGREGAAASDDLLDHFLTLHRGIARLEALGEIRIVPKDTILCRVDEVPTCCYIVKTGRVIGYEYSYTGDMRIYNFMEPGSVLLEELMLFDRKSPVTFKTTMESRLCVIDKCALKHAFKVDIDVVLDICESITDKFLSAMEMQRYYPIMSATWKLCSFFLMYARHYGEMRPDGRLLLNRKISQQTIADVLGMNRVTVTRKIGQLENIGLLSRENGFFVLKSIDSLERYMDAISMQED